MEEIEEPVRRDNEEILCELAEIYNLILDAIARLERIRIEIAMPN
ncbi:MAG: hypothetical protein ACRC8K_05315 [Waterburya sp.]